MSTPVVLPPLGESVTEGTVTRWLKQVGDTVQADEGLLEISTDKVDTEIPSPVSGVVEEILFAEDDIVTVGAILARIGGGDAKAAAPAVSEPVAAPVAEPAAPVAPAAEAPTPKPAATPAPVAAAPVAAAPASSAATEIRLPELGESVTEVTVIRWLKQVGDDVAVDEPLVEISTDKVDTEVPSPVAGTLQEILVAEDDTVSVGAVFARVAGAVSAPAAATPVSTPAPAATPVATPAAAQPERPDAQAPTAPASPSLPAESDKLYVTPLVRRLAAQQGVDLALVVGSGVGGRVRKEDVMKAAAVAAAPPMVVAPVPVRVSSAPAPAPAPPLKPSQLRGTTAPMSRLRKVLAERAVASMQQTAQLTTVVEVDVTRLAEYRDAVKGQFLEATGNKLSFLPFFALAAAEALRAFPIINSTVDGEQIVYPASENLSIAVDTERGLLTPVVRDAASKNVAQLAGEIADLAERTRANKLKPDELSGGTFTLTNTGSRGALFDTPVVFLPQSAILGTGIVVKRPGIVNVDGVDAFSVRSYVYLALSYDHRIIDGADAARFLGAVKARLESADFAGELGI